MKRVFAALAAALLCAVPLGACGNSAKTEPSAAPASEAAAATTEAAQGNVSAFNLTEEQVVGTLTGMWSNQNDFNEKIRFAEDLTFIHYIKADRHSGAASLSGSGMLTLVYEDGYQPEKTYIWVDSLQNANGNTWYMNGSTISIGGVTFIRDKDF